MKAEKLIQVIVVLLLSGFASQSGAATVSYILDQSNLLEDGVDYLSVTLSNENEGQLDFWVEPQSALSDIAGENFGIQSFAFNIRDQLHPGLSVDDFLLPDGWKVQFLEKGMSEAGKFDVRLMGRGNSRQDPLHFSIRDLMLDDVFGLFATHVAGFELPTGDCRAPLRGDGGEDGNGDGERDGDGGDDCIHDDVSSAFFYGDRLVDDQPSAIPVPAAAWLFGSGLVGLGSIARGGRSRKRSSK